MAKTKWIQDSEARQLRAERGAAMQLRNAYNDPATREKLPENLKLAAVDLLTADNILEEARADMRAKTLLPLKKAMGR